MNPHRYPDADIAAIERVIREQRDMRHFHSDPLPAGLLQRLIEAAHLAPSVGYMQPWRFIRIVDRDLRAHPGAGRAGAPRHDRSAVLAQR